MPILYCGLCYNPVPDSFHDFKEVCTCKSKKEWIAYYKRMKWCLKLDGKVYDFTIKKLITNKL